jgi:hypothetical protein
MKKIYTLLLLIISFYGLGFSQTAPKFELTKEGFKPLVIQFDSSYSENLIYSRIKEWIVLNNKNPKSVTKIDNENSLIKFSCYKPEAWVTKKNNVDYWNALQFTFAIEIKKAKCRVSFASEETRYKYWYSEDGTLLEKFKESEVGFENTVNETLASMYSHIIGTDQTKKEDW